MLEAPCRTNVYLVIAKYGILLQAGYPTSRTLRWCGAGEVVVYSGCCLWSVTTSVVAYVVVVVVVVVVVMFDVDCNPTMVRLSVSECIRKT